MKLLFVCLSAAPDKQDVGFGHPGADDLVAGTDKKPISVLSKEGKEVEDGDGA